MADENLSSVATPKAVTLEGNPGAGSVSSIFAAAMANIEAPKIEAKKAPAKAEAEIDSADSASEVETDAAGNEFVSEAKLLKMAKDAQNSMIGEDKDENAVDEDGDSADDSDDSEDDDSSTESDSDSDSDSDESDAPVQKKPIVLKVGDKVFKHSADAKVSVTVDGKETEAFLADVLNQYSGKVVIDREMNKVRNLEKTVRENQGKVDQLKAGYEQVGAVVERAFKSMKEGKGLDAMHEIVMLSGKYDDPIEWEAELIRTVAPTIAELSEMDANQQNAWLNKRRLDYIDAQKAEAKKKAAEVEPKSQIETGIKKVREAYSITDSEWQFACEVLGELKRDNKLAEYGVKAVTPETAAAFVLQARASDRTDGRLKEVAPKLKEQIGEGSYAEIRNIVISAVSQYSMDDAEVDELIREALPQTVKATDEETAEAAALGRKLAKVKPGQRTAAATKPNADKKKPAGPITFGNLRQFIDRSSTA